MVQIIQFIFQELVSSRSFAMIKNEMVFNEIFVTSMVRTFNEKNGALALACSPFFVQKIFDELIWTFFTIFQQEMMGRPEDSQFQECLFLMCNQYSFISSLNYFLDFDQVFPKVAEIFQKTFHFKSKSYQFTLLQMLNRFLSRKQFNFDDKLDMDVSQLPPFRRYYLNPKQIKVQLVRQDGNYVPQNYTKYK